MIIVRVILSVVVALLLPGSPAGAVPVTWTLSGVIFQDGSEAHGSFVFDADVHVYTELSITTNRASYETGEQWEPAFSLPNELNLIDGFIPNNNDGKHLLILFFLPGLTNSGGTVPLDVTPIGVASHEGICNQADC